MKEHSYELRKKASVVADYYKTAGDDYEVRCQARERKTTIFEIGRDGSVRGGGQKDLQQLGKPESEDLCFDYE